MHRQSWSALWSAHAPFFPWWREVTPTTSTFSSQILAKSTWMGQLMLQSDVFKEFSWWESDGHWSLSCFSLESTWMVTNFAQQWSTLCQSVPLSSLPWYNGTMPRPGMSQRQRIFPLPREDPVLPQSITSVRNIHEFSHCCFNDEVQQCLTVQTDISPESADNYLIGHCIDGRVLYPATGYLVLAWRTLVRTLGVVLETTPVSFEDVTIHRATILPKTGECRAARRNTGCLVD